MHHTIRCTHPFRTIFLDMISKPYTPNTNSLVHSTLLMVFIVRNIYWYSPSVLFPVINTTAGLESLERRSLPLGILKCPLSFSHY